ncbi:uncharacterized protein CELE_Y37E3.19 [Caenorhabditis elegans]|uniref:Uncharacterized protein n=1 Tax=Caenorhabditis elegans TaxID=6239 RepID=Q1EPL3_CAEEL|nr:Uncharacterized protein CELE_Y37E3.19 [Caenorhabditis elegans]CCD73439.2 Uncharacterized protein CELE_Y37E3.19 [Caenorhabditis elegans]|eukprot:NP_001040702.2 Uncharacterized protein CELE_Y37E3.19 [Caenorhabditis elegans]
MIDNYSNMTELISMNTLFSCIFTHFIIGATLIAFCTKQKAKSTIKEEPSQAENRPQGGNETFHFTPPHIKTAVPTRSLLRQKHQQCPVHYEFSEDATTTTTFVDSAHSSDIQFDSTQSASDSSISFLKRCTCFCAQKRVRFQCPPTTTTTTTTTSFGFI